MNNWKRSIQDSAKELERLKKEHDFARLLNKNVTHIVKISGSELYIHVVNSQEFVIRVGKQYLTPDYGSFKVIMGDMVVFNGGSTQAVEIGIICTNTSLADETIGVRILERSHTPKHNHRWHNVHLADIFCVLKPYKKKKKLWRLWMEYPGVDKTITCTIKIDDDLELLAHTRRKLREQCMYPEKYKYFIREVEDV